MGLANLRARASDLGAELRIDSARGQGTRVSVRVPASAAQTSAVSAGLQRGLLLGLAVVFHLGLVGRPVLGEWVFWSLFPFSAAAAWLSGSRFRTARLELARMIERLGGVTEGILRLQREREQARFLLVVAACAWNPLFSVRTLSFFGFVHSSGWLAPGPLLLLLTAALAAILLAIVPLQRALQALRARLTPDQFRAELGRALEESTLPLVVQLGTIGVFGRFLHEPMIALLPVGLAVWLGSLGYWALRSRGAKRPGAQAARSW